MIIHRLAGRLGLRQKLILVFALFVILSSLFLSLFSLTLFSSKLSEKNLLYINDITYQTMNSVTKYAQEMEDVTFSILSNNVIQENLRLLNGGGLTSSNLVSVTKRIEEVLLIHTLYNSDIISLSVFSDHDYEVVSRSTNLASPTKSLFGREELYEANGTALWGLINDGDKDLCVARAILDLRTQKPIGYVNLVFRQGYIGNLMKDISISYANGSYLLDDSGLTVSSNVPDMVGKILPLLEGQDRGWSTYESALEGKPSYMYKGQRMKNGWTMVTAIPKNELARESFWVLAVIVLVDALVILVAVFAVWALVKRITSPFHQLCRSMEEVGQGNFERREIIDTNDEIGMLSRSYNEMVDNIESLIEHVYKLEISNRQAELEYLKMQINPHFLYNTLDTISWMARIEKKDDIAEMTIALASLLRTNLKQDSMVPIRVEMESIRNYLLIQKYRFGSKFTWDILVEPACEQYLIPSFILQPLVENAIIHGLEPKREKGKLLLSIKEEDGLIKFVVADDGVGMSAQVLEQLKVDMRRESTRATIGMRNADRRLRLHFGEEAGLRIESETGIGTRVCFMLPTKTCRQMPQE